MWRGISPIAASTVSSPMPFSRRRSIMRARVRAEVMPLPAARSFISGLSRRQPVADRGNLLRIGQIDAQRRHRDAATGDGVEIGAGAGVLCGAGGADPVDGFVARILG